MDDKRLNVNFDPLWEFATVETDIFEFFVGLFGMRNRFPECLMGNEAKPYFFVPESPDYQGVC